MLHYNQIKAVFCNKLDKYTLYTYVYTLVHTCTLRKFIAIVQFCMHRLFGSPSIVHPLQPFLCLMEDFLSVRAIILMCSRLWNFLPGNGCFNLRIPIITCRTTCLNSHFHHPISVYYLLPYCQNSWWKSTDQNFLTRSCILKKVTNKQLRSYILCATYTVHYMPFLQVCKVCPFRPWLSNTITVPCRACLR